MSFIVYFTQRFIESCLNNAQLCFFSGQGSKGREYPTSLHALRGIIQKEGLFALYNGLSAGLLRQATYTTTRLGVYTWLLEVAMDYEQKQRDLGKK